MGIPEVLEHCPGTAPHVPLELVGLLEPLAEQRDVDPEDATPVWAVRKSGAGWGLAALTIVVMREALPV